MEIPLINIGNSKGIRLPKTILRKYDIQDKVEIILEQDRIILKPKAAPRSGWAKSFQEMNKSGDDELLIDDIFEDETFEEWN